MQEPIIKPWKRIVLIVLVIVMAIVAFALTYRKYGNDESVMGNSTAGQVKGSETMDSDASPLEIYSNVEAFKKMELTLENIIWFANYYRVRNDLTPLRTSGALRRSAYSKTLDMFTYDYFEHVRPNSGGRNGEVDLEYFVKLEKYDFLKVGENLAQGNFQTSKEVVDAWMKSPAHKKNILDARYTQTGVSIQTGAMDGKATTLIAQHFGQPRSACPSIDEALKSEINALKKQLTSIQSDVTAKQAALGDRTMADADYNILIAEYNQAVNAYNDSARKLSGLVATYNGQVKSFDQCLNR